VVLAHLVCLAALLLAREQQQPLLRVQALVVPGLSSWPAVIVVGVLVMGALAALALAARQAVVTILRPSRSLLLPSCRPLRSLRSFSSLLEACSMMFVRMRVWLEGVGRKRRGDVLGCLFYALQETV
jgi:hypothetical protein